MVVAPWFSTEVRIQAPRVLGRLHLDDELCRDVAQDVVLLFHKKLARHGNLGADRELVWEHFAGWMANMIRHACIDVLKRRARRTEDLAGDEPSDDAISEIDLRLDMAAAIGQLAPRPRQAAIFNLHGYTIEQTAAALGLHSWQIQYALEQARHELAKSLAAYHDGER